MSTEQTIFDYIIIGSGFGGSVSAMRLTEKGYSVLVLEQGKRFADADFAITNKNLRKFLWIPQIGLRGILQISPFRDVIALHGAGVGGGSLVYANVLIEPDEELFQAPEWNMAAKWKEALQPHFATARHMLGVTQNQRVWPADTALKKIADSYGRGKSYQLTPVGVFFGEPGKEGVEIDDPYFGGKGPRRSGCTHCGGCMVGCRYNAKNTLVKNYLYFAEQAGARIISETEASAIIPIQQSEGDARYTITARTKGGKKTSFQARNVIVSAGTVGTMKLLLRCKDSTRTLANLSPTLGTKVRTNSESLLGATSKNKKTKYSDGVAITSIMQADDVTAIEPLRYSSGSVAMRYFTWPLVHGKNVWQRMGKSLAWFLTHPLSTLHAYALPGWADKTTILLLMQKIDISLSMKSGRSLWTLFRKGIVTIPSQETELQNNRLAVGDKITKDFAKETKTQPFGAINEGLLGIQMTAHILGGCPFGSNAEEGVIDTQCRAHGYPGLYIIDGSVIPGNPGVNPSLTIAAFAEYAMSFIPAKHEVAAEAKVTKTKTDHL